ncbi:cytochrome P450 [Aspergillus aurantiobrunneus]
MPSSVAVSIIAVLCIGYVSYYLSLRKPRRFPPGPPPLPIIGNLHQLSVRAPWESLSEWHEKYGPIVYFRVGPFPVVVVSTMEACHELFDRRGKIYSSRPQLSYVNQLTGGLQPLLMPYNRELRQHRQIYRVILDPTASQKYRRQEELESCRLLYNLLSSDEPSRVIARYTPSVSSLLTYGERIHDWRWMDLIEQQIHEGIKGMMKGGVLVDAIPVLDWLPRFLSPWKSTAHKHFKATLEAFSGSAKAALGCDTWNWIRATREMKQAESLTWEQFCYTTGELFEATFLTTSMTLRVFMMICATQTTATSKASDELERLVGPDRLPCFDDLPRLPYLCGFTKEILRWRPVIPLGGPHAVTQDDEYNGYFIPANATVMGNVWAIHMDRAIFGDPEVFRPERWIENPDLPLVTFGFGRRICPGRHVARDILAITVARLLWAFEITTSVDPLAIDTLKSTLAGIVFSPEDVQARFRIRSDRHSEAVRRAWLATQDSMSSLR